MSPYGEPLRHRYTEDLEQLRLQVELMGLKVDQNLERMRECLATGDPGVASAALAADDEVDAMNVSLTEHCYTLLACESPMAADLRLIVSVVKVLSELERVGDLALRVVKLSCRTPALQSEDRIHDVLLVMADEAIERFRTALRAWVGPDLSTAVDLVESAPAMDNLSEQLTAALLQVHGTDAVPLAVQASVVGRALDRIADHAAIIGARVRYLVTGEAQFLAAEVR
jgi:phosphate transport system protein